MTFSKTDLSEKQEAPGVIGMPGAFLEDMKTEFRTTAVPNATVLEVKLEGDVLTAEFLDRNQDNDLGDDAGLFKMN